MSQMTQKRIEKIREIMTGKGLDAFMVSAEENRRHLSGFTACDGQFDETAGALFITEKRLLLATDSRYALQAEDEAPLYETVVYKKGLARESSQIFKRLGAKRVGFESVRISVSLHNALKEGIRRENPSVELLPADGIVESLRIIKSEDEIEKIRKALGCAESAFDRAAKNFAPGMKEKEAAWELEKAMRENGADSLSFPVIAASGGNSALPHAIPGHAKTEKGRHLLLDWGARVDGYCSDISRTVFMGNACDFFKKVYNTVYDAQQKAIAGIHPGVNGKKVDEIARKLIDSSEFKGRFSHGLGHGVGMAVHEEPRISPFKDIVLEPGMVFTVEPGIYISGWGGVRIENMVAVREDGAEVLNGLEVGKY